jgi:hypothetical protein
MNDEAIPHLEVFQQYSGTPYVFRVTLFNPRGSTNRDPMVWIHDPAFPRMESHNVTTHPGTM